MDRTAIETAANGLGLTLKTTNITKAMELYRLAETRGIHASLGKSNRADSTALPFLCLDLACELMNVTFYASQAAKAIGVNDQKYRNALTAVRNTLQIPPPPVTFGLIATKLGSVQIVPAAERLKNVFQETWGETLPPRQRARVDWEGADLIAAVFFVTCQAMKVKVAKKEVAALAANQTSFENFISSLKEYCKEEIGEIEKSRPKSTSSTGSKGGGKKRSALQEKGKGKEASSTEVGEEESNSDEDDEGSKASHMSKKQRMGSSAANPNAVGEAPSIQQRSGPVGGVNVMVKRQDIRSTKKYEEYLAWRDQILSRIEARLEMGQNE
ncbi:Origin of replication complex subunit 6 [Borealophlyctis nickersoniae]|nr:Origin of replication complex subunit 6 [Borealophlyctis nickersoniae]